jgi:hypothetical protein
MKQKRSFLARQERQPKHSLSQNINLAYKYIYEILKRQIVRVTNHMPLTVHCKKWGWRTMAEPHTLNEPFI